MKKIIVSPFLFIAACLLFASCGQDISIAKRHYRSGYYVAINNNKPVESKTIHSKKTIPDASTLAVEEIKETTNDNVVENEKTLNAVEMPLVADVSANDSKQGKASTAKTINKVKAMKALLKNSSKIKEAVSSVKDAKKNHRSGGGGNLLWTILLILLVLILLGAILGGSVSGALIGLITLILVIVLVIWLLRLLGIL